MDDLGLKRRRRVVARRSCGAAAEKFWEREECGQIVFCAKVEHIRTTGLPVEHNISRCV